MQEKKRKIEEKKNEEKKKTKVEFFDSPLQIQKRPEFNLPTIPNQNLTSTVDHVQILKKLSNKQKAFYDCLKILFEDGFIESRALVKSNRIEVKSKAVETLSKANVLVTAAGLLPVIGSACTGFSLINHIIQLGAGYVKDFDAKRAATRIHNLAPELKHMISISENVSLIMSVIYAEQCNQLKNDSIQKLAQVAAAIMFHYIATDKGTESTYLKMIYKYVSTQMHRALVEWQPSLFSITKSSNIISPELEMLDAILKIGAQKNSCTEDLLLLQEDENESKNKKWYAEELLTSAGIRTLEGKLFLHKFSKADLYGYRILPEEYAKKAEFKEFKPNNIKNAQEEFDKSGPCVIL